jgi:predicted Rossmann fold flavoprotein
MSGGTRCNITHATDNRGIVEAFGPPGRFLHSALAALSVQETLELFEAEGVPTKVEETGKVFPVSSRAADVLAALLRRLERSGAELALDEAVRGLQHENEALVVTTSRRQIRPRRVILTSGGMSYPGSGTTGDGYAFASDLGHSIVPPRPALVPIRVDAPWIRELRGVTIPDVAMRVFAGESELARRRGSLLFAHFGLTGPVALDVSRAISGYDRPRELVLEVDMLPAVKAESLDEELRTEAQASGKKILAGVLGAHLPRRLSEAILSQAGMPTDRKAAQLTRPDRSRLVEQIKRGRLKVAGTLGFEKAEVTAGGISLDEIDSRSLQSKIVSELYVAGEILDLDGPIGGYNFQSAFSTGWLAATRAAESLLD